MKTHHLIENICLFGDPCRTFVVALVVPSKVYVERIGHELGRQILFQALVRDIDVIKHVLINMTDHGIRNGLKKFEIPRTITLVNEDWTPEAGLLTASFKVKRKPIQYLYQNDIDRMYQEQEEKSQHD